MSASIHIPDADMALDLSAPIDGYAGQGDDDYIDYSDDEPETSPIKPSNEIDQQFESKQGPTTATESHQDPVHLSVVDNDVLNSASDATDAAQDSTAGTEASASGIIANENAASTEVADIGSQHQDQEEEMITWEEDETMVYTPREEVTEGQEGPAQDDTALNEPLESNQLGDVADLAEGTPGDESTPVDSTSNALTGLPEDGTQEPVGPPDLSTEQEEHASEHEIDYEEPQGSAPGEGGAESMHYPDAGSDVAHKPTHDDYALPNMGEEHDEVSEAVEEHSSYGHAEEASQGANEDETGYEVFAEGQDDAGGDIANGDSSVVSLDTPEDGDAERPAVTVSWREVDYPLFYNSPGSEDRECFFDDINMLHCKMEDLLASFRRELINDLADTDELVFQVDELGLEFAESTQPDEFSEITLGGVVQIFDTLVKNKAPEASRPMYAYLVTRPRCSQRWHALIEDAYQGKNIDEVSHSFHINRYGVASTTIHTLEHEDPEMALMQVEDEIEEGHEGVANDDRGYALDDVLEPENEGGHDGDEGVDEGQALEAVRIPEGDEADELDAAINAVNDSTSALDDLAAVQALETEVAMTAPLGDVVDGTTAAAFDNGNPATFPSVLCHSPDFCLCRICSRKALKRRLDEEAEFRLECFILEATREDFSSCSAERSELQNTHVKHTFPGAHADNATQAPEAIEPSNPIAETVADDSIVYDDTQDLQTIGQVSHQDATTVDDNGDDISRDVVPTTATTSTINGHGSEDLDADIDLTADMAQDGAQNDTTGQVEQAAPDDLDEIDWRDFPGQGDDVDIAPDAASTKRPRSEVADVLGEVDEQDAKRRRS